MKSVESQRDRLIKLLKALRLTSFTQCLEEAGAKAQREGWSYGQYLYYLAELELTERERRRIERMLYVSKLPKSKTLESLDLTRLPTQTRRQIPMLCEGEFVRRADNLLVFGLPGRGKTHVVCAIGHELIRKGFKLLFTATYRLVQHLLRAKRELRLDKELKQLDSFDAVILDDIGYIAQDRDEMEVLFTFLAERYERKSVMITSNLVFSQWDRIFKDPMTTAAAIDRLVHHSIILELTGLSYRTEAAKGRKQMESEQGNTPEDEQHENPGEESDRMQTENGI